MSFTPLQQLVVSVGRCRAGTRPTKSKPYPPTFYKSSLHEKSRISLCVICLKLIPRRKWESAVGRRVLHIPDGAGLRKKVEGLLPGYDFGGQPWMATSICDSCRRTAKPASVLKAQQRVHASKSEQQLARDCDGYLCDMCKIVRGRAVPANKSNISELSKEEEWRLETVNALSSAIEAIDSALHKAVFRELLEFIATFLPFCKSILELFWFDLN